MVKLCAMACEILQDANNGKNDFAISSLDT
jgi:hypothetical protein